MTATAAVLGLAIAGSAALNARQGRTASDRAFATQPPLAVCLRNETDSLVQFAVDWAGEKSDDVIAPQGEVLVRGEPGFTPRLRYANFGSDDDRVHDVPLKPAPAATASCGSNGYAFRYGRTSGLPELRKRTGTFLLGPGIAAAIYALPEEPEPGRLYAAAFYAPLPPIVAESWPGDTRADRVREPAYASEPVDLPQQAGDDETASEAGSQAGAQDGMPPPTPGGSQDYVIEASGG